MTGCFLIKPPSVSVCYCYPKFGADHGLLAVRFAETFKAFPPGHDHDLIIVSNGGPADNLMKGTFYDLPHRFIEHDDSGWDIGAFQRASRESEADLMVFFGGSSHFHREGWLARMVEAWQKHGPGLYGAMANTGVPHKDVWPHLRTTGFWLPPALLNAYPNTVRSNAERYPFEHGKNSLSRWVWHLKLEVRLVTFSGEYLKDDWDGVPNGYHNGDQSEMLVKDKLCEPPYWT